MVLNIDREKGHIRLSTKKLEPNNGDMIRNPGLVFNKVFSLLAGVIFYCHLYGCLFFVPLVAQLIHLLYFRYYDSLKMNLII